MSALSILRRRRERRIEQRQKQSARHTGVLVGAGLSFFAVLGLLLLGLALAYAWLTADLPSSETLPALLEPPSGSLLQPTRIYDRTGKHLLAVLAPQDAPRRYLRVRDPAGLPAQEMSEDEYFSPYLVGATVALIDPAFWVHPGYTLNGLNDPNVHPTIPQKLIAELVLWQEPPGLRRALRERLLAAQLVRRYGRQRVLEWYLNAANYGRLAYGADSAAWLYFGKSASELNLAESALLAAVNQSPAINPLDAPQAALQRQQEALKVLQAAQVFPREEIEAARLTPLTFSSSEGFSSPAPAFVALALSQLEGEFDRARVERGGMVILTTLDYEIQAHASCAIRVQLARLAESEPPVCEGAASLPPLPPGLTAPQSVVGAAILDPRSGQVLALVGETRNGQESAFWAPRRPGSLLTPFVYLTGFTRGLSPASLVWDLPPPATPADQMARYRGPLRLRIAMANDLFVPTQQVFNSMGAALVAQTLRAFGLNLSPTSLEDLLQTENRYTVLEIARIYGIFAAQGTLVGYPTSAGTFEPWTLLSVRGADGRNYIEWNAPESEQVVSAPLAYLVNDVLRDGTAREARNLFEIGRPAAVKTASLPQEDAFWVVGYTPQRVVALWMAGDGLSERAAAGLGVALLRTAANQVSLEDWPRPPGIVRLNVCDPSGLLPSEACPNVVVETFLEGYQPLQPDSLYRAYQVNRETGLLATVFTPPDLVETRIYLQIPPEAAEWAAAKGIPSPPTAYDTLRLPRPSPFTNLTAPALFAQGKGKIGITGTAAGEDFVSYRVMYGQGLNPSGWVLLAEGNQPVENGTLAEWDTTGLNGLFAVQLMVFRAQNRIETASTLVTVDNQPPDITLDFPRAGAEISLAETPQFLFQPRISDNFRLQQVEFWLDDRLLSALDAPPFAATWQARRGAHTLRILARDALGNETRLEVQFTVK
ncbi:MAG: transglycosylase domain-containing protein [Anaerolineales bacterium]|nr:transglycosylase domain-containing protein [Anaerolineales bacterium]MDW8278563.1 transglycosylase domain-containing protein [Anaerolineales bacterium]